jgi:aminoglycoside phosphotransferase (APT) family kinase protein
MASRIAEDVPAPLRSFAGAVAGMERLWALDRDSATLCMVHGDPHPGNLFFEQDGTPGFLDWQRLMQCDWAHDVAYFIIGNLDVSACVAHERDLLAGYLQQLAAQGVSAPDWDDAWLDYRRHAMYGLVWNVVPPVMQPAEVCEIEARRFNAAARRLDVHDALFA